MSISFAVAYVKDIMTPQPVLVSPDETLCEAAFKMEEHGCGFLPVGAEGHLEGIITDRDIVVRGLAGGANPATARVGEYMTQYIHTCRENDTIEEAAELMSRYRIGRLVVKDNKGRVTGVLSFGNILRNDARPEEIANIIKHAAGPVSAATLH